MKKSLETFQRICDAIVNQGASLTRAAHAAGLNASTLFRWLGSSAEHPNEWLHEWGDFGIAPFHIHVKNANKICVALLQGEAVRMALNGFERTQVFQGRVQYQERLDIPPGMTPDEMEVCYGVRDRYVRDEMGNMIPLKIAEAPNPQLMAAVLRALGGDQWADKRSVDVRVQQAPGVTTIRPVPVLPPVNKPEDDDETPMVDSAAHLSPPPTSRAAPPVLAESPAPRLGEDDPPEMVSVGEDGAPLPAAPTVSNVRAQWEALLATSRANTASKKPTGIVNTGLTCLSDTPSATSCE